MRIYEKDTENQEMIVKMPVKEYERETEANYFAFVLGTDLLKDYIINNFDGCDIQYDECYGIALKFLDSKEYEDTSRSSYEMLCKWLTNESNYNDKIISYVDLIEMVSKRTTPNKVMFDDMIFIHDGYDYVLEENKIDSLSDYLSIYAMGDKNIEIID